MNRQTTTGIRRTRTHMGALVAAIGATVAAAQPAAAGFYEAAAPRDVDMCIAEVRARADLRDAGRVQHAVASTKRRVGFAIEIETTVFAPDGGAVLREYETVCVATGGERPSRFAIRARD